MSENMPEPDVDSAYKGALVASDATSSLQTPHGNNGTKTQHSITRTLSSDASDADTQNSIDSLQEDKSGTTFPPAGDMDLLEEMELEKERYPGAATWAEDEERLFEMFFLRQELPMLPADWALDFRGVPISEANFTNKMTAAPLIHAHSQQNRAAAALVQLVELTASIRTTSESGLHHRVPHMIKDGLHRFLAWAAEDGGYRHLRVVPNIIVEVVDTNMQEHAISELMQGRMRALGRLQREFLREDRDPRQFWDHLEASGNVEYLTPVKPKAAAAAPADEAKGKGKGKDDENIEQRKPIATKRNNLVLQQYLSRRKDRLAKRYRGGRFFASRPQARRQRQRPSRYGDISMEDDDELAAATPHTPGTDHPAPRRRSGGFVSLATTPTAEFDELATPSPDGRRRKAEAAEVKHLFSSLFTSSTAAAARSALTPAAEADEEEGDIQYRRPLPVVYGLFVLNTSVFILTADAALGDTGYVSFHVETDFMEHRQSVWNALTLGLVACQARDELRRRVEDFEPRDDWDDESDPDL